MKMENSVVGQKPWFMDEARHAENLVKLNGPTKTHVEDILRDGFTVIRGSISRESCTSLIEIFKRFADLNSDKFSKFLDRDGHYPRIVNLHAALPQLFQLFSGNTIAYDVQQALFGVPPCLYTTLFYERGSAQPLHRDTPYFSTRPEYFYFGVWVALEDANEENGALQVMPGGHNLPELDRAAIALRYFPTLGKIDGASPQLWDTYQAAVVQQGAEEGLTTRSLCVEAGDTVIWHPQLPHGGGPIQNLRKSRFSLVMHTTPVGVPVYHQDKFFNPDGPAPTEAPWNYTTIDGKHLVAHDTVDFGHQEQFHKESFIAVDSAVNKPELAGGLSFLRRLRGRQ